MFATRFFPNNAMITYFHGRLIVTTDELREHSRQGKTNTSHFISLNNHFSIEGISQPVSGQGGGSFSNDSRGCAILPNATVVRQVDYPGYEGAFLKAARNIEAGEEVLFSYDSTHWSQTLVYLEQLNTPEAQEQADAIMAMPKRLTRMELEKHYRESGKNFNQLTKTLTSLGYSFPKYRCELNPAIYTRESDPHIQNRLAVEIMCFKEGITDTLTISEELRSAMKNPPARVEVAVTSYGNTLLTSTGEVSREVAPGLFVTSHKPKPVSPEELFPSGTLPQGLSLTFDSSSSASESLEEPSRDSS
ncbi:SET domain-containing protein-lysine N-methyltransferase [Sansalvadorimonas verongulae]|uniref:SET domain-containing protein-lysine N-methyltransferase n=1 Tax=Sansalvadorimonas verongulae TaxID=2172824 RepID=UPI0018AD0F7F|nr:SET domain-containing protein [Sansalvadorimonas verongulae]